MHPNIEFGSDEVKELVLEKQLMDDPLFSSFFKNNIVNLIFFPLF